jgi:hypothetical protein
LSGTQAANLFFKNICNNNEKHAELQEQDMVQATLRVVRAVFFWTFWRTNGPKTGKN